MNRAVTLDSIKGLDQDSISIMGVDHHFEGDEPSAKAVSIRFCIHLKSRFEDAKHFDIPELLMAKIQEYANQGEAVYKDMLELFTWNGMLEDMVLTDQSIDAEDHDGTFRWNRTVNMPFVRVRQGLWREVHAPGHMVNITADLMSGRGEVRWFQREALRFFANKTPVMNGLQSFCTASITGVAQLTARSHQKYLLDYFHTTAFPTDRFHYRPAGNVTPIGDNGMIQLAIDSPVSFFDPEGVCVVETISAKDAWKLAKRLNRENPLKGTPSP